MLAHLEQELGVVQIPGAFLDLIALARLSNSLESEGVKLQLASAVPLIMI